MGKKLKCPKCNVELEAVYFLGSKKDFYVCPKCHRVYTEKLKLIGIEI